MKTKKIMAIMAGTVCMITSCTNEADIISDNGLQNEAYISFQTSVGGMTRANITTESSLKEFVTNGVLTQDNKATAYMSQVAVSNVGGQWTTAEKYVWPYTGSITFTSWAPKGLNVTLPSLSDADPKTTITYTASSEPTQQKDVLYAVNKDCHFNGSEAASVVNVNFRHALAQIVFQAKVENENWEVDIKDVKLHNVKSKGVYTLPTASTLPLNGNGNDVRGTWSTMSNLSDYNTGFKNAVTGIRKDPVVITSSNSLPLLLIPQQKEAWDAENDPKCTKEGAYFTIQCQLRQKVTDGSYVIVWPDTGEDSYANVAIPVSIDWLEGKKYTYIFNFKDGAGYIPPTQTDGGEDIGGKVVLRKITYDVKVDNFEDGSNTDVNM